MSAVEKRVQELAMLAFAKISQIAASNKGKNASLALSVIEKIVTAVRAAYARKITPAELARKIELESRTLAEQLAANDKTIASEIDDKFPAANPTGVPFIDMP